MATYRDFLKAVLDSRIKTPYDRTAAEIAAGVTPTNYEYPPGDVRRYGAVGDWNGSSGTDNLEAFNAAYAVAYAESAGGHGAEIFIPEGRFYLSDEWNVWRPNSPRRDISIRGVDQNNSRLVCGFFGAAKALVRCVDPAGTSRASPLSIRDLGFEHAATSGGANPVYISILGHGESRLERLRFNRTNNSVMRLYGEQNLRATDIVSFFGGRNFNKKNTAGITFSVDTTANTITASAAIFDASDVGKYFFVYPSTPSRYIRYTISSYISATVVGYAETTSDLPQTDANGHFEPARCSMTAGSNVLTADANCFTENDVGLVLYVRRARAGAFGDALLRGEIVEYIAPNQVRLSRAADNTVTNEFFAVPVIDMGQHPNMAGSSDVKIDKLHIESYSGVALVCQNTDSYHIVQSKLHGVVTLISDTDKALAAMWLDDHGGRFELDIDSGASLADARIYCCNLNDTVLFDCIWSRWIKNGTLIKAEKFTNADGYAILRGLHLFDSAGADPESMIEDANYTADATDPRVYFDGVVNMVTDSQQSRRYVGRGAYFLPDGRFVLGPSALAGSFAQVLSAADGVRMLFEDAATKRWSIGNTPGGGQNFVFRDESAGANRIEISGLTGALFPSADATLDSGASGNRWNRTFTNVLAITDGVSAPAAIAGYAVLYVDSADGDLKVIFPDGTVKTIVTDT